MLSKFTRATVVDPQSPWYKQTGDVEDVVSDELGTSVCVTFSDGEEVAFDHAHVEPEELLCGCGSLQFFRRLYDARGIYVGRCCDACEAELRTHYRPEIFSDSSYECDEQIDED